MKKILFVVLLVLLHSTTVFCGDLPESLITNENADVFVGEIASIDEAGKITINVSDALFSNYEVASITVAGFRYMTDDERYELPQVGDYCAIAVEYINNGWSIIYEDNCMAAKSDSLEPETLKLYGGENAFINRMNGYINDGTYSYNNRKQVLDRAKEDAAALANEEHTKRIASETEIVIPPPAFTEEAKSGINYWIDKPIIRYTAMTLIAAFISYVFARIRTKGRRNRD